MDSWLLSSVYIDGEQRKKGYARELLKTILPNYNEVVFLTVLYDGLIGFYEKFGFRHIGDNCMKKPL